MHLQSFLLTEPWVLWNVQDTFWLHFTMLSFASLHLDVGGEGRKKKAKNV